jgi:CubicO group peptidase (beta-lactamase class C family)
VAPAGDVARPIPSRPPRLASLLACTLALALLFSACGVGRAEPDEASPDREIEQLLEDRQNIFLDVTWELIDERLDGRVGAPGPSGAALVVDSLEGDDHVHMVGDVDLDTEVPLAETSMWLTTAVLLSLVDDGTLSLDEPVGATLPPAIGEVTAVTLRQLLSHTSGLPAFDGCSTPIPEGCDVTVGESTLVAPPGEGFVVSPLNPHTAARLAEVATGTPWAALYAERIAGPVGLTATTFADPAATGGLVGVDGTTTAADLGRFLAMVRDGGAVDGVQVLSEASVREMLLDQTVRLDTHDEPWVAETGVPTFGLGVWRDRLRGDDAASVVSAPNRYGLYPFVDDGRSAWGIVVIDDRNGSRPEVVGASALIAQLTAARLRSTPDPSATDPPD